MPTAALGILMAAIVKERMLAHHIPAHRLSISKIKRNNVSLVAEGYINSCPCRFTIHTGTTISVINGSLFNKKGIRYLERVPILETAAEDDITVYGNASLKITLWHSEMETNILIAGIMDKFILGIDIATEFGFIVDVRNEVLWIGKKNVTFVA